MSSWKNIEKEKPTQDGEYLCVALIPQQFGAFKKSRQVMRYNTKYGWMGVCNNAIITHWKPLLEFPDLSA